MSQVSSTATSSTNFATIFTAALEAYKQRTKKDITSHPLAAQLQSCDSSSAILTVLRDQVQAFDQSHSADNKLTRWLDPTVNVLYAFSVTLGNGVGLIFPPSNAIFAGIGVLLQAVKDVRASQNALIDLFGRLENFFKRLENYIGVRPTATMLDIIVKIMVEVLSILGIVTKEIGQGKIKKYLNKLGGRKDVEDALQRLDQLTQEEARMATAETLRITRSIDDKVKDVDEKVVGINEGVRGVDMKVEGIDGMMRSVDSQVQGVDHKVDLVIEDVKMNGTVIQQVANQVGDMNRKKIRKDLRKWVAFPDPSVNYNAASNHRHKGTAAWCTKGDTLADWKRSGPLLWIHGKPGSGKSVLSSAIIQDIKAISDSGDARMAYFFFDFTGTEKQDSRVFLSSLLVQLSNQSDQLCDILQKLFSAHKDGSEQPTDDSLFKCLENMLTIEGQVPIYLIMDALDECPNDSGIPSPREKVLELVKALVEIRRPNLRLCITSRPEFDIRTTLEPLATQQLSLHDEDGQKQDINDYITFVVHSDQRMKKWRDDDKNAVIEGLTEKANGMFRWVFCQLDVLRHCFPKDVRRVLEELPKSLDETYERILKQIRKANRLHALRLLQCLTVAVRPLRVEELAEVLAFDLDAEGIPKLSPDWRWEDQEEAVLSACSSLVSIINDEDHQVVQFSHFSVKEFLTSDRLATSMGDVSQFHIPIEPSHVILSQACLGTLFRLDDNDNDSAKHIPLVLYAAQHWVAHAQVGNVEVEIKDAMDYFFDIDKSHFPAWVRIQDIQELLTVSASERPRAVPFPAAPLYFAARRGFRGLVERLAIKHPQQVNHMGGRYGAPLHASVLGGYIKVAQILLEHNAEVNASNDDLGYTPLHLASDGENPDFVQLLLNHSADARLRDNSGRTPLHVAASRASLEVVRILFKGNVEVNSRDNDGSTALHRATRSGNRDIVRFLLDHDADVGVRDNSGYTPLHIASFRGHLEVARLLLERNPEINSQDDRRATPLHRASKGGSPDVARLLLDHDADVHMRDERGNTPLHLAAANGNLEVTRVLLERHVEVDSRNDKGSTPLLRASEGRQDGDVDIVRLLLDHGADAQARNLIGQTASELATGERQQEIIQLLSNHAARMNRQDVM